MIYTLVRKDRGGNVDSIISFDSVSSMDEAWTATVSTQTVEKGFNISDNINIEPEVYSIEAIISSYSLFIKEKEISWDGSSFRSRGQSDKQSHVKAREEIIKIFKEGSVLSLLETTANSVSSNLGEKYKELRSGYVKEIEDCVITSMSISHPSEGTGAFFVSLKLQKIYTASVRVEELPEGQSVPLLTPMQAKEASVASTSSAGKTVDGVGGVDGVDGVGGVDESMAMRPEDGSIPKPSKSPAGMSWEDGYSILQRDLSRMREVQASIRRIRQFAISTNSRCTLVSIANGGYKADCIRG